MIKPKEKQCKGIGHAYGIKGCGKKPNTESTDCATHALQIS